MRSRYATTSPARIAVLPRAPITASPVPWLTSLYHKSTRGDYGDSRYPGNCSGELIKDLLLYFRPKGPVFDPMTGSGTMRDVCNELKLDCVSKDIRYGFDACDERSYEGIGPFEFIFVHPPYWRQKVYGSDPRDMSAAPTLPYFMYRYEKLLRNLAGVLAGGGKLCVLMGDYSDRAEGFVPLTYHTQRLAFQAGLKLHCTPIVRFSHGASSSKRVYTSSFIPGLHDVCFVFEK